MNLVRSSDIYCGWIEVITDVEGSILHSFSVNRVDHGHLVDCGSICMSESLIKILEPIRNEKYFIDKISGCKEAWVLCRDLQGLVNEMMMMTSRPRQNRQSASTSVVSSSSAIAAVAIGTTTYSLFTSTLLKHIEAIGWENVEALSADMSTLSLACIDSRQRRHVVDVNFTSKTGTSTVPNGKGGNTSSSSTFDANCDSQYPQHPPRIIAQLPVPVQLQNWSRDNIGGTLQDVIQAVRSCADQYGDLLGILDDIDQHCYVLEPRKPSFAVTSRRIAIERLCSIYIEFPDPIQKPYSMCNIRFLGPPEVLSKYQHSLQNKASLWNTEKKTPCSVRENLQLVLGITLPAPKQAASLIAADVDTNHIRKRSKTDDNKEANIAPVPAPDDEGEYVTECGICYSFNSDNSMEHDTMPDQVCPNANCGKMYHSNCISEWLHAVPSSRSSFGTIFGNCPYCNEWLSVSTVL